MNKTICCNSDIVIEQTIRENYPYGALEDTPVCSSCGDDFPKTFNIDFDIEDSISFDEKNLNKYLENLE